MSHRNKAGKWQHFTDFKTTVTMNEEGAAITLYNTVVV